MNELNLQVKGKKITANSFYKVKYKIKEFNIIKPIFICVTTDK